MNSLMRPDEVIGVAVLAVSLCFPLPAFAAPQTVIVVTDGSVPKERVSPFVDALREVAGNRVEISDEIPVVEGDWTRQGIESAFADAYAKSPDLVLALGTGASSVALGGVDIDVPIVAPWVIDPVMQGLTGETPANVYPVRVHLGLQSLAQTLRDVAGIEKVTVLADPQGVALLDLAQTPEGLEVVTLSESTDGWLSNLPEGVEGVIVGPLGRLDASQQASIADALVQKKVPSLALAGPEALEQGFMMSQVGLGDLTPLARNAALLSVNVLLGKDPEQATWTPANTGALALQMETVSALGVAIPFDVLTDATLVGGPTDAAEVEDMDSIVSLAIDQAPGLQAERAQVDAARSLSLIHI